MFLHDSPTVRTKVSGATPARNDYAQILFLLCFHVLEKASPSTLLSIVIETFMNFPRGINKPVNQNTYIRRYIIGIKTPFCIGIRPSTELILNPLQKFRNPLA